METIELIEKERAVAEIGRWKGYIDDDMIARMQIGMRNIQPVSREEHRRIHSKWALVEEFDAYGGGVIKRWRCSNCGYVRKIKCFIDDGQLEKPNTLFCEKCGAEMEEEDAKEA